MIAVAVPLSPAAATMPGTEGAGATITQQIGGRRQFVDGLDRLYSFDLAIVRVDEMRLIPRTRPLEDFAIRRGQSNFRAGFLPRARPIAGKKAYRDDRLTLASSKKIRAWGFSKMLAARGVRCPPGLASRGVDLIVKQIRIALASHESLHNSSRQQNKKSIAVFWRYCPLEDVAKSAGANDTPLEDVGRVAQERRSRPA